MIQRIQSIWLFLSFLALGSLFLLPFADSTQATAQFLNDKIYNIQDHAVLLVLTGLACFLTLGAIFLFNNRALQLRVTIIGIVVAVLLIIAAIALFFNEASNMAASAEINDRLGIFSPIVGIIFSALGARSIRKDENLVSSMDRLR